MIALLGCGDMIVEPAPVVIEPTATITKYDGFWTGRWAENDTGFWNVELQFSGENIVGGLYQHLKGRPPLPESTCAELCQWFPFYFLALSVDENQWSALANISGTWSLVGWISESDPNTMEVIVKHIRPEGTIYTLRRTEK